MKLLALETSEPPGSLALLESGPAGSTTIVYERRLSEQRRTTESFAVEIQQALAESGWHARAIDRFAVSAGPGSFTGLRIGITAAKTFAYATDCQVVGIPTLAAVASQFPLGTEKAVVEEPSPAEALQVWAVLNAQRKQLFVCNYGIADGAMPRADGDTTIQDAKDWLQELPPGARLIGSGLKLWRTQLCDSYVVADEEDWSLRATSIARLGYLRTEPDDLFKLNPNYFRKSAAEEKRMKDKS